MIGRTSNIKFNENFSCGCRVVPCGRSGMTKVIDAYHIFENAKEQVARQDHTLHRPVRHSSKLVVLFCARR